MSADDAGNLVAISPGGSAVDFGAGAQAATTFVVVMEPVPAAVAAAPSCPAAPGGALLSGGLGSYHGYPFGIAVGDGAVAVATGRKLVALPSEGGAAKILTDDASLRSAALHVRDGVAYWGNLWDVSEQAPGRIASVPLAGGPVTVRVADLRRLRDMTLDDQFLYWTADGVDPGAAGGSADGGVWSVPLAGGQPSRLATGFYRPSKIAAAGGVAVFLDSDNNTAPGMRLVRVSGGTTKVLTTTGNEVTGLAVDGTHVYWTERGDQTMSDWDQNGFVRAMPLAGGAVVTLADHQPGPVGIALLGDQVYWATGPATAPVPVVPTGVWRVAKTGGTQTAVATQLASVLALSAGDDAIAYIQEMNSTPASWVLTLHRP
jgi:hypothetical protein